MRKAALALLMMASSGVSFSQVWQGRELVRMSLVADASRVAPNSTFRLGVLLEMAPGWHTYWQNPGDAGMPTRVEWCLPEGFTIGALEWPLPQRVREPGDVEVFAYKGRVLLMAAVHAPATLPEGPLRFSARAEWLVCEQTCIPGEGEASLEIEAGKELEPAPSDLFAEFQAQLPDRSPLPYRLDWQPQGNATRLVVQGLPEGATADFFPLPEPPREIGHTVADPASANTLIIPARAPLRGVVVVEKAGQREGWTVEAPAAGGSPVAPTPASSGGLGLGRALLYGFLGGLILNLMPCVLPVISLKIFGFMRLAGGDPRQIWIHGLAFTAGIFAWFFALAAVVAAIKAGGGAATWAFQFQNAWFNLAISAVVFVFALNLFGVFEVALPGRAATALDAAGGGEGLGGSFFQGVFATLLATPCTAPFLGTALGFAFSQPAPVIFAMFAAVAAGMASPYVLLSARPAWIKYLPKPGPWMEKVKQFMGFPLLATLLWLLSILGSQKGVAAVIWAGSFLLCLGFAAWLYGAFCGPSSRPLTRLAALALAAASGLGGAWLFAGQLFAQAVREPASRSAQAAPSGIPWVGFSRAKLDQLLAQGRGVFLDFTADWCITCKVNERAAIDRPAVRAKLEDTGIVPMKADWTNPNAEIQQALAAFGRVGVPFYVIYPPGKPDEPMILPELLTEGLVLEALSRAAGR